MHVSRSLSIALISALIGWACVAALLVLVGRWDDVVGPPLVGDLVLHEVQVPAAFKIDPVLIADELVKRMQRRSESDLALRILLGDKGNELLRDRAVPRLVNAGVVRRMVEEMEGLGTVIAFGSYRSYAPISIRNTGETTLDDVAITLPHAVLAERGDGGGPLEISEHDAALGAISLGRLAPGAAVLIHAWFDEPPAAIAARGDAIRLGADGGVRGNMRVYPAAAGWNGADLQVLPWARWLIAAVLAAVAFAAFATLALTAANAWQRLRFSRA
jgi:hypothetical protein